MINKLKENILKVSNVKFDLFKDFIESEKSSGYLLILLTIISMVVANSQIGQDYIKILPAFLYRFIHFRNST